MHRYEELEKRYYRKKYLKISIYTIFVLLIIVAVYILYYPKYHHIDKQKQSPKKELNKTKKIPQKIKKQNKTPKQPPKPKPKPKPMPIQSPKKLTLYPIYPEIDNNITKSTQSPKQKPNKIVDKVDKVEKHNTIIIKSKPATLNSLIESFNTAPEYEKAIKVTKLYFDKEKYEEAIQWAKKANKLKPEDYESWYIFAESLIKLGKIQKAKKVLIAYIDAYGPNKKIEKLLRSIK